MTAYRHIPFIVFMGFSVGILYACNVSPKKISLTSTSSYPCIPFHDSVVKNLTQTIPGRIQNEYYDVMDISDSEKQSGKAEGICYHDDDNINSGSGKLNKTGTYLKEFRMFESPDISYTKFNNCVFLPTVNTYFCEA